MSDKKRKVLKFRIGDESIPVVLTDEELKDSPFHHTIERARECLEKKLQFADGNRTNNVTLNPNQNPNTDDPSSQYSNDNENWENEIRNNIIAFFGNRGTGKTSCMRSVVSICKFQHEDWMFTREIDPSCFDDTHNILEILVGELYGTFKDFMKNWQSLTRQRQDDLREINESFLKVKSTFRYLDSNKRVDGEESDTDCLRHLNDGGRLRSLLNDLITAMLRYVGKKCLVISIDDLDLNIAHSYEMMEYIRKYLVLPNVAIIIAARYQQLFDSICLVLSKHYKDLQNRISDKDISEMAERYLNKLVPLDQRFDMPIIESVLDSEVKIVNEHDSPINPEEHITVADKIPALIFEKTRYLFYNSAGMPSLIIPRNLRDVRMLFSMLYLMNPFDGNEEGSNGLHNQRQFKAYFFQEWMGIIAPEYRDFAKSLLNEENPAKINRFVITNLYDFFIKDVLPYNKLEEDIKAATDQYSEVIKEQKLLRIILDPQNSYWNVSIGDAVTILDYVRSHNDSAEALSLLFFIETFYSIKLYESYNEMTDSIEDNKLPDGSENLSQVPQLKTGIHGELPSFFRLVGGSFFSLTGDRFIPSSGNSKESRERRLINGQILMNEIRDLVHSYHNRKKSTIYNNNHNTDENFAARLRLCEFFMLTTRERIDMHDKQTHDETLRHANEPLYFNQFGNKVKNLMFDVSMPFLNAIYPKYCYDRFNSGIFEIAKNVKESLLNRMIRQGVRRKDTDEDTWELMSKASIRNMEILQDLTSWMQNKRESLRPKGKDRDDRIIAMFFRQFRISVKGSQMPRSQYCVKTYGKARNSFRHNGTDKTPYYLISYEIFSQLATVLDEIVNTGIDENTKDLCHLFESIMSGDLLFVDSDSYNKDDVVATLSEYCTPYEVKKVFNIQISDILTSDQLLAGLAELRFKYRYEFHDYLDQTLQIQYDDEVKSKFEDRIKECRDKLAVLKKKKTVTDNDLTNLNKKLTSLEKAINQYNKDKIAFQKTENKLNGELERLHKSLDDKMSKREQLELPNPDAKKLDKEIEKIKEKIGSVEAQSTEAFGNIYLYNSIIQENEKSHDSVRNEINDLHLTLLDVNEEIEQLTKELKDLEFRHSTPIDPKKDLKNP